MISKSALNNFWPRLNSLLGIFFTLCLFSLIFIMPHRAVYDPDIWLHLKTGEIIVNNKAVPSCDTFSFALGGRPWADHEWLFQASAYLTYNKWHADGLIALASWTILLCFVFLFLIGRSKIKSYTVVAFLVFLSASACEGRFNIRPDIFSILFFTIYLYLFLCHTDRKVVWILVPIQVLWVNFHGYFFLGPLVAFFFIVAVFLERRLKSLTGHWQDEFVLSEAAYTRLKRLFVFILLACLLNPGGLSGALYPLGIFKEIASGKMQIFFDTIQELLPALRFDSNLWKGPYYILIILCFFVMAINFKRLKLIEIFLVAFLFLFGLKIRNVPFFVVAAYTIIVSYPGPAIKNWSAQIYLKTPGVKRHVGFLLSCFLAASFIILISRDINKKLGGIYYDFNANEFKSTLTGIDKTRYLEKAVDFVLANNLPPRMFNDFDSGAYLVGRAYPARQVFIDGRTELYGVDFYKQYDKAVRGNGPALESIISKYNISAILLSYVNFTPAIISYVYKNPQWRLVYFDDRASIFLKDIPANQGLIKKFGIDFSRYSAPHQDLNALGLRDVYPVPYLKRASVFELLQENRLVILEAKEALRISPGLFKAYSLLGRAYLNMKKYPEALENLRAATLISSRNSEALTDLGACLREMKEYDFAIRVLKGIIKLNPRYGPAYYQLGRSYLDKGNESEGIKSLEKAIKYEEKNARYHYYLGQAYFIKGKAANDRPMIEKARSEIESASRLNINGKKELEEDSQKALKEIGSFISINKK